MKKKNNKERQVKEQRRIETIQSDPESDETLDDAGDKLGLSKRRVTGISLVVQVTFPTAFCTS